MPQRRQPGTQVHHHLVGNLGRDAGPAPDAPSGLIAVGLLQALYMQGSVLVPDEIALIGYDDISFAQASVVPLSSIRQPSNLIGATAVDILLEEAADPDRAAVQIVFQPELVIRASTGPTRS